MTIRNRIISTVMAILIMSSALPSNLIEAAAMDWIDYVNFSTDHTEQYINTNNKKIDNQENVVINPLIQIKFKYKLDKNKLDKSKIKLRSNDGDYFVLDNEDIWINHDDHTDLKDRAEFGGKILKIDLNTVIKSGKYPLRKNTLYKLTIEKGAVSLTKPDFLGDKTNEDINIHFITGNKEVAYKNDVGVNRYSSDKTPKDDITNLIDTRLGGIDTSIGRDGKSIYIHMNEKIRWNTDKLINNSNNSVSDKISLNKEYFKHFKFYRLPKAYETDVSGKIDKELRYDNLRNVHFKTNEKMVELDIESIEILSTGNSNSNILKITPKEKLRFYNMHYLKLADKEIITDIYGRKLKENIDKYIWSTNSTTYEVPNWIIDFNEDDPYDGVGNQITAEEIINNTNTPSNKSVLNYRLYGVPKYNEYINDKSREKPITLYVDDEVIPNPNYYPKTHPNFNQSSIYNEYNLSNITLREEHALTGRGNHEIKWYKLEYYEDSKGKRKTKISLYPKGELDAGKPYELNVLKDTFVTRNAQKMSKDLKLKFIIEGERVKKRGIYTVTYTSPLSIYDTSSSLKLDIKGFNFTEDIRSLKLKNTLNGEPILLSRNDFDVEFINVDNIKITLRLSGLNKIRKRGNGGTYTVSLEFGSGDTAESVGNGENKLIIYETPYVIETIPKANDLNVDKDDLYQTLPNGKSGNYLTVIFDNINGMLEQCSPAPNISDFTLYDKEGNQLVDKNKEIIFEGIRSIPNPMKTDIKVEGRKRDTVIPGFTSAKLFFDDDKYQIGDKAKITLFDSDLNTNSSQVEETKVTVSIQSDEKILTLTETGSNTGRFEGEIEIWNIAGQNPDKIKVEYLDKQPAIGSVENRVEVEADIIQSVSYKRRAQLYIEKDVYEKDEQVKITVVDKSKSGSVQVNYKDPDDASSNSQMLTLYEVGTNTGTFQVSHKLNGISNKFEVTYSYTEKESEGISGRVKMYIPITDQMKEGKIYVAKVPEGIVCYGQDKLSDDKRGSREHEWSFKTGEAIDLSINVRDDFKGSVPEDYDASYPISLTGNRLTDKLKVYFKDSSGKEYEGRVEALKGDDKVLHVFLPTGNNKLPVGLYNIVVRNTKGLEQKIEYGVFSVVPKGEYVPNEEYVQTDNKPNKEPIDKGSLKKYIKTSYDTLELSSKESNAGELKLKLDEIMGAEVWSRNIGYEGSSSSTISKLITESKWGDITLTNVTLDRNSQSKDILIRIGRVPALIEDNIKKKVVGKSIKSDFIEVGGNNYTASKLNMNIPFKESNGKNLKLLRYDEETRRVTEIVLRDNNINNIDKRIEIELNNEVKGIFVLVE